MRKTLLAGFTALTFLSGSCTSPPTMSQAAPRTAVWRLAGHAMATAADKRAVDAAIATMNAGGSAVDAAIAAHAILGLVEPQSSGLGGGGYMVVYDRKSNTTTVFDGRETAPLTATADYFTVNGKNLDFVSAILSGKSVGTPGAVALYKAAHEKFGKLPWGADFEAAIKLADEGFIVSPRLANSLSPRYQSGPLGKNPATAAYFFPNGKALAVGDRRTNPEFAATLRAITKDGPAAFYSGAIAQNIVNAVHAGDIQGDVSLKDLAAYRILQKPAICGPFRDYKICSAPPSSSGGVAMNQIMSLYDLISTASPDTTLEANLRDLVLAEQLGYADRDHYVADPDAVTVPAGSRRNQSLGAGSMD